VVFLFSYRFFSWADLLRVSSPLARAEAGPAITVFSICFVLNIPLGAIHRVQMGLQQSYLTSAWQLVGAAVSLGAVVIGIRARAGLPVLLIAIAGAPVLASVCNLVQFFGFKRCDLRPQLRLVSYNHIGRIATLGGLFFVLQSVVAIAFSADGFIIARSLGAVAVPDYAIPQRMFSLISIVVAMMVSPLWPAYGEAISRGDSIWVRRTLTRSMLLVFGGTCLASIGLFLCSHRLLLLWVGPRITPPTLLLLGLAIWTVLECSGNTVSMFMNGASIMRFQIVMATLFGVACLTTKIVLVRRYGIVVVPWCTVATYVLFSAVPYTVYVLRFLQRPSFAPRATGADHAAL
jgi:O-antigen/teichoic acid export membrane protein